MPEEKVRVEVFHIKYRCDECGIGFLEISDSQVRETMRKMGQVLAHTCSHCGVVKPFDLRYPYVVREENSDKFTLFDGLCRMMYQKYMQGAHWHNTKRHKLLTVDHTCERCGANKTNTPPRKLVLTVHHKTYERMGNERMEDLEVLCDKCHDGKHNVSRITVNKP